MDIELISTDLIDDNPYQVRQYYNDIPGLASDILSWKPVSPETLGLQHIPAGRDRNGRVQLVFGHRRLRAFRFNALTHPDYCYMPVRIVDFSDAQMLDGVWAENNNRIDSSDIERAELMRMKYEQLGTHAAVAAAWGLDRSTVTNLLGMLDLPDKIKEANQTGRISGRMLDAIARLHRVSPKNHLIQAAINHPEKYSSNTIRLAARKQKARKEVIAQRNGAQVVDGLPRALKMSGHKAERLMYKSVEFTCKACQDVAPVNDTICDECPLTIFLRRLSRERSQE